MIRLSLLFLYVLVLVWYARRDWLISLCGAILLMAVVQHPDMPRNIGGIQGLNPWNVAMLSVLLSWAIQRKKRGLSWDVPREVTWALSLYGAVVFVAFVRMMFDRTNLDQRTTAYLVSEYFVNCFKWVLPGVVLYDTCRTERQVKLGLLAAIGIYLLLAVQVIRWMPFEYAMAGDSLSYRASKIIQNEIGYNRVNMSMLLAGGSWAFVATTLLFKRWQTKVLLLGGALTIAIGQALTAGRTGYAVWALVGLAFGLLRWRRLLALTPVAAVLVLTLLPGVSERLFKGFSDRQGAMEVEADEAQITSGRNRIWPFVIEQIRQAPILGHGRLAMNRLGLDQFLRDELGEDFSHPHNAYLEVLLDSGAVGLVFVLPFYAIVVWRSIGLFTNRSDTVAAGVGGIALALVLALLIAGAGSQTFYPREGSVGMWATLGVMLRVSVERRRSVVADDRVTATTASAESPHRTQRLPTLAVPGFVNATLTRRLRARPSDASTGRRDVGLREPVRESRRAPRRVSSFRFRGIARYRN